MTSRTVSVADARSYARWRATGTSRATRAAASRSPNAAATTGANDTSPRSDRPEVEDHGRAGRTRRGSIGRPALQISRCRCGPVVLPVRPTRPMTSPATTDSPTPTAEVHLEVTIGREDARAMVDLDHDRAVGDAAREHDPPGGDRVHRRAERCRDVEPVMEVRVADARIAAGGFGGEGRRAEGLGDPAIERPDNSSAIPVAGRPAKNERRVPVGRVVAVEGARPVAGCAVGLEVCRGRRDRIGRVADVGVGESRE